MTPRRPKKPASQPKATPTQTALPLADDLDEGERAREILRRAVLREKARRVGRNPSGPLAQLFDRQLDVIRDTSPFKALLCGRRGGKTGTAIRDAAHVMATQPNSLLLYVALSGPSARQIFWAPFKREAEAHGWGFKFNSSAMIITHSNGSQLLVRGVDKIDEIEKLRGVAFDRVYIDECGSMKPSNLKYLVLEVLEATTMDRFGQVWLMGTPTVQAFGFFFDVTNGRLPGYSVHRWTARDNPHVDFKRFVYDPDPKIGLLARRGWDEDNPIFKREYLAEWVVDPERLVYRFLRSRNVVAELPKMLKRHDRWRRVLGLDFGVMDATAASLLAYPEIYGQDTYVQKSWSQTGLAPSDAADYIIKHFVVPFRPDLIVGDVGGIGKAFQREWNKRYPGVEMKAAEKRDKRTAIEITSDALHVASTDPRRGLFSLECNDGLHREWSTLLWDEDREDIADGQDDNEANAAQYAYRECPAYSNALQPLPVDTRPKHLQEDDEDYVPPPRHYQEVSDL